MNPTVSQRPQFTDNFGLDPGTASRSDIKSLLIDLREDLKNGDPVKDIANCIAHSTRDRGDTFEYVETFVDEFVNTAKNAGRFHVRVLFPLGDLIEQFIRDLEGQHLSVKYSAFHQQSPLLRTHFGDIMDGVKFKLSNTHVMACEFSTASSNPYPTLGVKFQGLEDAKVLPISPMVELTLPVFFSIPNRGNP